MVRYSEKQLTLNAIVHALEVILPNEAKEYAESKSESNLSDNSYSSDNSPESSETNDYDSTSESSGSDDNIPHSRRLVAMYAKLSQQCYTVPRMRSLSRHEKLINMLDRFSTTNPRAYRGFVRMTPQAFNNLALHLQQTKSFLSSNGSSCLPLEKVREMVSVALYRLGRSGNGSGERDGSLQCGCSVGSYIAWTERTVEGLMELNAEVMQFATEEERRKAKAWVKKVTEVEEWGRGWLVVDGTHVSLAWKPGMHGEEHFNYKGFYSINVAVVIMPHSLRIVESVVGHPGSAQDSKVWTSGSNILKKPRLYLDEGEFVWTDGGYGHHAVTVAPFTHQAAERSRDLRSFNYTMSRVRVRVEHAIAYLKNRFQCLSGYRGNIYRASDRVTAAKTIQACIVAHTFASQYDRPDNIAELLLPTFPEDEVVDILQTIDVDSTQSQDNIIETRRANQRRYEQEQEEARASMSATAWQRHRVTAAHDLREEMFSSLFQAKGWMERDTNLISRRHECTIEELAARTSVRRSVGESQVA